MYTRAAEVGEDGSELATDHSGTHDHYALGLGIDVEDAITGEYVLFVHNDISRHARLAACGDDDAFGVDLGPHSCACDAYSVRADHTGRAALVHESPGLASALWA